MKIDPLSTRQHILDVGYQLIVEKGFSNVGLSQLLSKAEVPKGSFYHYFKSKECFGEAVIDDYFSGYRARLEGLFSDKSLNGYETLINYWQKWVDLSHGVCGSHRCLVVKLSGEVSDLSEAMRLSLLNGANSIISMIALVIQEGINDGSIKVNDAKAASEHLYHLWVGASLMTKLNQNTQCVAQAFMMTKSLLKGEAPF